jgi:nucleotide-binding universal stress UspA family protein
MTTRAPVMAAVDVNEAADEVLRQGSQLAAARGVPFVVCHVLPHTLQVRALFPQRRVIDEEVQAAHEQRAREAIASRVELVTGLAPGQFELVLDSGSPAAGILAQADRAGAGLVAVGPGPVAERVARYAAWPVLVARSSVAGGVVGATDFSDPSMPALRVAADEARRRGVALRLVHCVDLTPPLVASPTELGAASHLPTAVLEEYETEAWSRLREVLQECGVAGDVVVVCAPATLGILDVARAMPAELIVVGTRGATGLPRLLLGSVAESVLSAAPCSVLVVPLTAPGGEA